MSGDVNVVYCSVEYTELPGDFSDAVPSVIVVCSRCGHRTESWGQGEKSITRCFVLMRKECPRKETRNKYLMSPEASAEFAERAVGEKGPAVQALTLDILKTAGPKPVVDQDTPIECDEAWQAGDPGYTRIPEHLANPGSIEPLDEVPVRAHSRRRRSKI